MRFYILDAWDEPREEDIRRWAIWMEANADRCIVGETFLPGIRIATHFLGVDVLEDGGPECCWETLVEGGPHDGPVERYYSKNDAESGHVRWVLNMGRWLEANGVKGGDGV